MERREKLKIILAKNIVKIIDFFRKPFKLLLLSFIFLSFFSHSTVAKKIVLINENVQIDNATTYSENFATNPTLSQADSKTDYSVNNEGFIVVTPGMDISKIQNEKIARNSIISTTTPTKTENFSNNFYFKETISDSSLLSQRSVDSCKEIISSTLSKIPANQYQGLKEIELVYDKNEKRGGANGTKISIRCNDISDTELKAVLIHELGHIVDGSYLQGSSSQKSTFVDLGKPVKSDDPSVDFYSISWENNTAKVQNSKNADFCSLYGATDPYEDFAECYIFYALQPSQFEKNAEKNEILKKKLAFIKDKIFGGEKIIKSSKTFAKSQVYDNTKLSHSF